MTDGEQQSKKKKRKLPTIEELEARDEAPWKTARDFDPYTDEVALFENVRAFIRKHVYFRIESFYDVVTSWILATYHMNKWRALGILLIIGPIKSGKTTLLDCLEETVYRGVRGGSMSNAVQFRMREDYQPTFLIDEAQIYNSKEYAELRAALNESYKRGGKTWRMVGQGTSMFYKGFRVYGATALALSNQTWEAMDSRGLKIKMVKLPKEQRKRFKDTLTAEFFQEGARLRGQLKQYRTRRDKLPHQDTDLDREIERRLAQANTREEKSRIVTNPFPDPSSNVEEVEDPRVRELGFPLVCCAPDTGPRENVVAYLKALAAAQEAEENTGYMADIFRAFDLAAVDNGKVSISDVRFQLMIIWDIEKLTDKRMPHPKTVIDALRTMGFSPTRNAQNKAAVFYDKELVEGLRTRYGISSGSSGPSLKEAGANGATGANPERRRVGGRCAVCQQEAELRPDRQGVWLICDSCYENQPSRGDER